MGRDYSKERVAWKWWRSLPTKERNTVMDAVVRENEEHAYAYIARVHDHYFATLVVPDDRYDEALAAVELYEKVNDESR